MKNSDGASGRWQKLAAKTNFSLHFDLARNCTIIKYEKNDFKHRQKAFQNQEETKKKLVWGSYNSNFLA